MPIRVLVVDDESSIRWSLTEFLEDYDFAVSSVGSAEEALDLLAEERYDVGIIDLRLPGLSGDSLIFQAHKIIPNMRFLIHTGSTSFKLSEELKSIGLRDGHVFLKPLSDLTVLSDAVKKVAEMDEI